MEAGELFQHCVAIINSYRPLDVSADSHAEDYIKEKKLTTCSDQDRAFMLEIFGGYIRQRKVVDVVVEAFFNTDGLSYVSSDKNTYTVACYTILFRAEEMGIPKLTDFIISQDWAKMWTFCRFLINKQNLLTWTKDEWRKIYEDDYVNEVLLGPLLDNFESLFSIVQCLRQLQDDDAEPRGHVVKRDPTVPEPFTLTKPKPRKIPTPEVIPKVKPVRKIPPTTYQEPETQKKLAEIREINKQKAQENLMQANQLQFACAATGKVSRDETERSEEIVQSADYANNRSTGVGFKSAPAPTRPNEVPVKLNTATILREERLFKEKESEVINKLEQLQAGAKDSSEFMQWQKDMRQKDYEQELADIERRRLEGLLSHEEAILARKRAAEVNRERANVVKDEAAARMRQYLAMKLKESEETRKLVEQVITGHKNAKQAVKKIQDFKQKLAQKMSMENKELLKKAFEEAEAEMQQKQEIIRQIRVLECLPRPKTKTFDPTEIAGYGLFGEMSLSELRERLNLAKINQDKEEAERRDAILKEKVEKENQIVEAMETINRHRGEQTRAAAIRLEEKRREQMSEKPEKTNPEVLRLQKLLEQKKQERINRQIADQTVPAISAVRLSDLKREKKDVEAGRYESIDKGNEQLVKRQANGLGGSARASRIALGS
ncbi:cilia- and flagella-associated protein 99-like [Symsagittifera roscoffensis]|uniref:cilia- and flagella-associated protein 99-like n=1 Tax=Symsagittifera roscoffensis TaxID=84072 RepID=UPI00307C703A